MSPKPEEFDPFGLVTAPAEPPVAGWYATPLSVEAAESLGAQARQALQRALAGRRSLFAPQLAELIAGFWLGRDIALDYRSLQATLRSDRAALAELVYGQLLMSRKLLGASEHLRQGFRRAVTRLAPAEYLALLRRHDLLEVLVLTSRPAAPQPLAELLREAGVIRRLERGSARRDVLHRHDDTLG
ncbi:MAG: hypothetical protein WCZ87_06430 [Thiohalobacteraceae bacterium]